MSKDTRFKPGQSGNPKGRPPKPRRPNVSAFEIMLDKRMTVTVGGKERELTVEEVLQQQTLKDALAGKRIFQGLLLEHLLDRELTLLAADRDCHTLVEHDLECRDIGTARLGRATFGIAGLPRLEPRVLAHAAASAVSSRKISSGSLPVRSLQRCMARST